MKYKLILTFLLLCKIVSSQYLFDYDYCEKNIFNIVKLKSDEKVFVSGESYDKSIVTGVQYYNVNDTIRFLYDFGHGLLSDTIKFPGFFHYPFFIKIRNNEYKIDVPIKSTVKYDDQGRITQIVSLDEFSRDKKLDTTTYQYLSDTTLIYNYKDGRYRYFTLYYLDQKLNLKEVVHGGHKSGQSDIDTTDKYYGIVFNYNAGRSRITSIYNYAYEDENRRPVGTQTFYYKDNRPVSSIYTDHIHNLVRYRLWYRYVSQTKKSQPKNRQEGTK